MNIRWFVFCQLLVKKLHHPSVESCHQAFEKCLRRHNFWVSDVICDAHGQKLFKAVVTYNSSAAKESGIVVLGPDLH